MVLKGNILKLFVAKWIFVCSGLLLCSHALAETTYVIDPSHTYPSFEADHMGLSLWRGKFNKTEGVIVYDPDQQTGRVELVIQADSMDFGHDKMNEKAIGPKMLDSEKFPEIRYVGHTMEFENKKLVRVLGDLTMKGVTKPVNLTIDHFNCKMHPFAKREACGATATAQFNRVDFGVDYAVDMGFNPNVKVLISVEAIKK